MGNKQSSGPDSSGVKKRKKGGKSGGRERPVSDPMVGQQADGGTTAYPIRRAGSENIGGGGMNYGIGAVSYAPNPVPNRMTNVRQDYLPGTSALASDSVLTMYSMALHQVLAVWPEYQPLETINVSTLHPRTLETLQQVFKRMCEQQNLIGSLSKEAHDVNEYVQDLKVRNERQEDAILIKNNEIEDLVRDIGILKGDLRRRGIDPRLPEKRSSQEMMVERGHVRGPSGGSATDFQGPGDGFDVTSTRTGISRHRPMSGYVATPIVLAEGNNAGTAIKRSHSLKSGVHGGQTSQQQLLGPSSTSKMVEDLNMRVRTLQRALETERSEKAALQERLDHLDVKSGVITSLSRVSGATVEQLAGRYDRLEGQALSRVTTIMNKFFSHVSEARRYTFFCGVMETAYLRAASLMEQFRQNVSYLLQHPLEPASAGTDLRSRVKGPGHDRRMDFQDYTSAREDGRRGSPREIPYSLEEEIGNYIRDTADDVTIDGLVEGVVDYLRYDFPEIATASFLTNTTVTQFLSECCRLAWHLNITSPPCHVAVGDPGERFDARYHNVIPVQDRSTISLSKTIDYFVWPILYDKKRGDVLYKGRVALKRV